MSLKAYFFVINHTQNIIHLKINDIVWMIYSSNNNPYMFNSLLNSFLRNCRINLINKV